MATIGRLTGRVLFPFLICVTACVDAVTPDFRFREGFILIDGQLASTVENSRLRISMARLDGETYRLEDYQVAAVEVIDDLGNVTPWTRTNEGNDYRPPVDFTGESGRSYFLRVYTPEGEVLESTAEKMPRLVTLDRLRVRFEQEGYFSNNLQRFVPVFRLLADFTDPPDETNYYRWTFVSWQELEVCKTCLVSRLNPFTATCEWSPGVPFPPRFDYYCATDCYEFRNSNRVSVLSDEFFDGNTVSGYELGRVEWDWFGPQLVVVEQQATTAEAFRYHNLLSELSEGSGGLNATLPAALDGNIDPVDPNGPAALGFFSVVATDQNHIFYDRDTVQGFPLPFNNRFNIDVPPPPSPPILYPCRGPNRSIEPPPQWPN